jgi:cation:H+ antiporter
VAVACLPVFLGGRIERWEGALFVVYYVAYVTYLVLDTSGHHALPEFRAAMLWFFLPLTGLTLAIVAWRAVRRADER